MCDLLKTEHTVTSIKKKCYFLNFCEHTVRKNFILLPSSNKSDRIMPSNKNAFNRYLILDELLSDRHHNYSIDDLTKILEVRLAEDGFEGVSRRCVEKDIVYLEYAPIYAEIERYKSETGKRCVRYADPTFSIFNKKLSNDERNLLCEVLATIGQFDGLDNFEWLEEFKAKLGVNEHEKIIYFSNNPYLNNSNLLGTLFTYIANKVVVRLNYRTFDSDKQKQIVLHPYLLKQYNNRWFVIGAADRDHKIFTFALDRINFATPLPDKNYLQRSNDLIERYEDIIGVTYYEGKTAEEIIFWASDNAKGYIDTKPIHGTQAGFRNEKEAMLRAQHPTLRGGKFYRIRCIRNYELIRELCSFGPEVIVISPDHIKTEIYEQIQTMIERYVKLRT